VSVFADAVVPLRVHLPPHLRVVATITDRTPGVLVRPYTTADFYYSTLNTNPFYHTLDFQGFSLFAVPGVIPSGATEVSH
jgi:hypothetical protein